MTSMKKAIKKSVFADDEKDICYLCGCFGHMEEHHIFGGPCRSISDKYGLVVHLCSACHRKLHDHGEGKQFLHELGQQYFEENIGTREQFIKEFIRSYL